LKGFGPDVEAEAIELHLLAMTSRPPIFYWSPATVRVMDAVRQWRDEGLTAYYTLDAGPNVHVLVEAKDAEEAANRLKTFADVRGVMTRGAGQGARVVEDHFFKLNKNRVPEGPCVFCICLIPLPRFLRIVKKLPHPPQNFIPSAFYG